MTQTCLTVETGEQTGLTSRCAYNRRSACSLTAKSDFRSVLPSAARIHDKLTDSDRSKPSDMFWRRFQGSSEDPDVFFFETSFLPLTRRPRELQANLQYRQRARHWRWHAWDAGGRHARHFERRLILASLPEGSSVPCRGSTWLQPRAVDQVRMSRPGQKVLTEWHSRRQEEVLPRFVQA